MPATPKFGLRYPNETDTPDVPRDIHNLASDVETALGPGTTPPTGIAPGECEVWTGSAWARSTIQKLVAASLVGYPADATKYLAGDGSWPTLPLTPPGVVSQYAGASAPAGWLFCDGSPVSRSTYAALFAAIGTTYGIGDGSSTFNLPDLRGKVPVGKAASGTFAALGSMGGAETHTLAIAELPSHDHGGSVAAISAGTPSGAVGSTFAGTPLGTHSHNFTGSALPTHTHAFTGSALAGHSHVFTGSALAAHTHAFSGNTVPDHHHKLTASAPNDVQVVYNAHARDGGTIAVVDVAGAAGATGATNLPAWGGFVDFSDSSAGSVGGTNASVTAGTPAGSINSVSAGTPAGTNAAISAGTPAGTIDSQSAGTPSGTVTSTFTGNALGTHAHAITAQGGGAAISLLSPYVVLNYIVKT
jgi:microcystin-dependent protein